MTIGAMPDCVLCEFIDDEALMGMKCKAFPDGIPDDIIFGERKHNRVLPGQSGDFIFRKRKDAE